MDRAFWLGVVVPMLLFLLIVGASRVAVSQQPVPKTCKDTPVQCDKELLLLREEVDTKRRTLAALWAMNEEWQQRAEKAEARTKELEAASTAAKPEERKE